MFENDKKEQLIGSILDELKELEMLTKGMQDPRMLQELAIKKAHQLLEHYEQLKGVDVASATQEQPKEEEVVPEVKPFERETTTEIPTTTEKEQPAVEEIAAAPVQKEVETPKPAAPTATEDRSIAIEPKTETPKDGGNWQQTAKDNASHTNNDRFKSTVSGTTTNIGSSTVKRVDSIFVKSLKSALKLNDRIRYSRELFGGSTELMNSTVDELDRKNNLGEALAYINAQFNWDKDNEAVIEFLSLLERRF